MSIHNDVFDYSPGLASAPWFVDSPDPTAFASPTTWPVASAGSLRMDNRSCMSRAVLGSWYAMINFAYPAGSSGYKAIMGGPRPAARPSAATLPMIDYNTSGGLTHGFWTAGNNYGSNNFVFGPYNESAPASIADTATMRLTLFGRSTAKELAAVIHQNATQFGGTGFQSRPSGFDWTRLFLAGYPSGSPWQTGPSFDIPGGIYIADELDDALVSSMYAAYLTGGHAAAIALLPTWPSDPVLTSPPDAHVLRTGDAEFLWSDASGADSYEIQVSKVADFSSVVLDTIVTDIRYLTAFPFGFGYYWRVRAISGGVRYSAWTAARSFSIPSFIPAAQSDHVEAGKARVLSQFKENA